MGSAAAFIVSPLLIAYAITLVLGLLSLKSPLDQIGDPYFTLLEVLIIILAPVLVLVMVAVHGYASPGTKFFSLSALAFMIILAGITSSVHFVVLTVSRQIAAAGFPWASMFFSFEWPSVAYTLDIFAWDVFFALSMLFAAVVFRNGRLETAIRYLDDPRWGTESCGIDRCSARRHEYPEYRDRGVCRSLARYISAAGGAVLADRIGAGRERVTTP